MGRIKNWLRGAAAEPEVKEIAQVSPELIDALKWGEIESGYGSIYRSQPSVYTVVEFLAWQIAGIGLKVYERTSDTDRRERSDSAIAALLAHPVEGLTYHRMMHALVADLGIYGNAYWLKKEVGNERVLMPLPPFTVTPRGGTMVQAARYDFRSGQTATTYGADEIVHFRRYNPGDLRIGVSPLEPLRRILAEERESSAARSDMWRNQARIPGWIERPTEAPPWTEEQRIQFRTDWQNVHAGHGNTGKTAVLEGMKFHESSWSPKETEFIEGRKLTLETVARAFNIPVSVLGLTESATFASQREFRKQLYVDTLGPWLRMIEDEIAQSVLPWFTQDSRIYVEFNVEEKLRLSFDEAADTIRAMVGVPIAAVNDMRPKFNLPRIEDEAFDVPVKPANVLYQGEEPIDTPSAQSLRAAEVIHLATTAE